MRRPMVERAAHLLRQESYAVRAFCLVSSATVASLAENRCIWQAMRKELDIGSVPMLPYFAGVCSLAAQLTLGCLSTTDH